MNAQVLIWSVIAAIAAVDAMMLPAQGMTIASRWPSFGLVLLMCSLSALVRRRNPAAARLAGAVAQIWALSDAGAILSYTAMAATPFAMADAALARWDAALGFDWMGIPGSTPILRCTPCWRRHTRARRSRWCC